MPLPPIKGFLEASFVDWPGKVAAVVFLPRCNFRCPYCHNHQLVLSPEGLRTWPLDHVLDRLENLAGWVDGVCVTGGEPTLHAGLAELLGVFRAKGLAVKLDTNGSRPEVLRSLLSEGLLDAVALDLKAPLEPVPYRRNGGSGASPDAVAETLNLLADWGRPVEVRTTVHPDLLSLEELRRLANQAGGVLGCSARFTVQCCRVDETLDSGLSRSAPLGQEEFRRWADAARRAFEEGAAKGRPRFAAP